MKSSSEFGSGCVPNQGKEGDKLVVLRFEGASQLVETDVEGRILTKI